jgi:hypothetical protein
MLKNTICQILKIQELLKSEMAKSVTHGDLCFLRLRLAPWTTTRANFNLAS